MAITLRRLDPGRPRLVYYALAICMMYLSSQLPDHTHTRRIKLSSSASTDPKITPEEPKSTPRFASKVSRYLSWLWPFGRKSTLPPPVSPPPELPERVDSAKNKTAGAGRGRGGGKKRVSAPRPATASYPSFDDLLKRPKPHARQPSQKANLKSQDSLPSEPSSMPPPTRKKRSAAARGGGIPLGAAMGGGTGGGGGVGDVSSFVTDGGSVISEYERSQSALPPAPKRGRPAAREAAQIKELAIPTSSNNTNTSYVLAGWWDKCHTVNHDHAFKELGYNAVARNINRRVYTSLFVKVDEMHFSFRAYSPIEVYKFK
ncbi:hypothetical protein AAMO2058_001566900 [Amorphochlora amoebiformis]